MIQKYNHDQSYNHLLLCFFITVEASAKQYLILPSATRSLRDDREKVVTSVPDTHT